LSPFKQTDKARIILTGFSKINVKKGFIYTEKRVMKRFFVWFLHAIFLLPCYCGSFFDYSKPLNGADCLTIDAEPKFPDSAFSLSSCIQKLSKSCASNSYSNQCTASETKLQEATVWISSNQAIFTSLGLHPEELLLQLSLFEKGKPIETPAPKQKSPLITDGSIGTLSNNTMSEFVTSMHASYEGTGALKASLSIEAFQDLKNQNSEGGVNVTSLEVIYRPRQHVDEIKTGYLDPLEDSLLASSVKDPGLSVVKHYQENTFELGWYDGVSASVTSPWLLQTPFTFYTRQSQLNGTDIFLSGLKMEKQVSPMLKVATELSESYQTGASASERDRNAFAFRLNWNQSKSLSFSSGIAHYGTSYLTGETNTYRSTEYKADSTRGILSSLNHILDTRFDSLGGFSNFSASVNWLNSKKWAVQYHHNLFYDHTLQGNNKGNEFHLSTLRINHALSKDSGVQLSVSAILFENQGLARAGMFHGLSREDASLIESAYTMRF
jgi:hypothetical protein